MIVIDALAVLNMLPRTSASTAVETFLFDPNQSLHAHQLRGMEVAQVPRRCATRGRRVISAAFSVSCSKDSGQAEN